MPILIFFIIGNVREFAKLEKARRERVRRSAEQAGTTPLE